MKLRKDDEVMVLAGRDKGKTGKIERILPREDQVVVAGINIAKRHTKPSNKNPRGGILELVRPVPAGKVALMCPACKRPTRIGFQLTGDHKERVCRKCQAVVK